MSSNQTTNSSNQTTNSSISTITNKCCDFPKCKRKLLLCKCSCTHSYCVVHVSPGYHHCPNILRKDLSDLSENNKKIEKPIAHGKFSKIDFI